MLAFGKLFCGHKSLHAILYFLHQRCVGFISVLHGTCRKGLGEFMGISIGGEGALNAGFGILGLRKQ